LGAAGANIRAEADRLAELMGLPSIAGVHIVATVPPQHSYGFESSVLLALLGGATPSTAAGPSTRPTSWPRWNACHARAPWSPRPST
jgi:hypothetical protein